MRQRRRSSPRAARAAQHGAATLVVVMVLFFIVALVAAYTSRNLIFEQRTAANQYGATQAFEAAEAGLEWALGMLNGGRINAACEPHVDPATADGTFRQRYLQVSDDGSITVLSPDGQALTPSCVMDATDEELGPQWRCECPLNTPPALVAPAGTAVAPAFRVRFVKPNPVLRPDLVRIESNGCTRLDDTCLNFPSQAVAGSGRASVSVLATLKSAMTVAPYAALTAAGNVTGAGLTVVNNNLPGPNITVHAGGNVVPDPDVDPVNMRLIGPAGMPSVDTIRLDSELAALRPALESVLPTPGDRLFAWHFGIKPDLYRDQLAVVHLDCGNPVCTGATLRSLVALNPGRAIWAKGDIDIDSDGDIGTPEVPVLLMLTGNLTLSAANSNLYGVVYGRREHWTIAGPGRIHGAAIAHSNFSGTAGAAIEHKPEILNLLRIRRDTFVRVPGSWRDFPVEDVP